MNRKSSHHSAHYIFIGKPITESTSEVGSITNKKPIIDYKKEQIFYFYDAMLKSIVKQWEVNVDDTNDSIPSGDEVLTSKPYEPCTTVVLPEEELVKTDSLVLARKLSKFVPAVHSSILGKRKSESRQYIYADSTSTTDIYKKTKKGRSYAKISSKKAKARASTMKRVSRSFEGPLKEEKPKDYWIIKNKQESAEIKFVNGNRYVGELYEKVMHGHGQFSWCDGTTYTGEFRNGEITGKGRIEYSDKTTYEGDFYKGYRHGYGNKFSKTNEASYNGQYYLGSKHGEGRMVFGPNNYYDGTWNMNKIQGKGLRHYASGAKYSGEIFDGIRNGLGTAIFPNNDFYYGDWLDGKKHGYGEYVWDAFLNNYLCIPVQNKYCGMWDYDYIHGFGLMYFGIEGGARYAGTFYRNIKHGPGIVVCNNGKVIKADPLFVNDKAIRIKVETIKKCSTGVKSTLSESDTIDIDSIQSCTDITCTNLEPKIFHILPHHTLKSPDLSDINNFIFPCYGFEKCTVAHMNQYKLIYPMDYSVEYVPLTIDLNSVEHINLTILINKVAAKYLYKISNTNNKENMSSIKHRYFKELKVWPILVSEHFCEDFVFERFNKYKECDNFFTIEETRVRKAIRKNLKYLKELYDYYAFIACIQERPNYKPWLMRICFWQLLMDCRMHYKNVSLNEIDEMMAEYSKVTVSDIHNPFDIIHFWDFLTCFLNIAWKLYGNNFIKIKTTGILEKAFLKFLETDIFPNARKHIGTGLFDYRDVIPITAAYEWFKTLGPNFTVYDFLINSCTLNKQFLTGFFQDANIKVPKIQNGLNIAFISDKIIYREIKAYYLGDKKYFFPELHAYKHGLYLKPLKFLFLLSGRKVLTILRDICPMIVIEDEYISMNHVLSFWEFYETVLRCTQAKVIQDEIILENLNRLNRFTIEEFSKLKGKRGAKKHIRYKTAWTNTK